MFRKALVLSRFPESKRLFLKKKKKQNEDFCILGYANISNPNYAVHLGQERSSILSLEFYGNCKPK